MKIVKNPAFMRREETPWLPGVLSRRISGRWWDRWQNKHDIRIKENVCKCSEGERERERERGTIENAGGGREDVHDNWNRREGGREGENDVQVELMEGYFSRRPNKAYPAATRREGIQRRKYRVRIKGFSYFPRLCYPRPLQRRVHAT